MNFTVNVYFAGGTNRALPIFLFIGIKDFFYQNIDPFGYFFPYPFYKPADNGNFAYPFDQLIDCPLDGLPYIVDYGIAFSGGIPVDYLVGNQGRYGFYVYILSGQISSAGNGHCRIAAAFYGGGSIDFTGQAYDFGVALRMHIQIVDDRIDVQSVDAAYISVVNVYFGVVGDRVIGLGLS